MVNSNFTEAFHWFWTQFCTNEKLYFVISYFFQDVFFNIKIVFFKSANNVYVFSELLPDIIFPKIQYNKYTTTNFL